MSTNNINITRLTPKLQEMLNEYAGKVTDKVKELAKETTTELVTNTKKDSPKDTGWYSRHIKSKKAAETSTAVLYKWYVEDPDYRLTHLISFGHKRVIGAGPHNSIPMQKGFIKGNDYLTKNVSQAQKKYIKGVRGIIQNER